MYTVEQLELMVREMNAWDGSFENLAVYENDDEFFQIYFESKVMEAVRAVSFGDYNYLDDYVRFNGYGNIESLSEYEWHQELEDEADDIVEQYLEMVEDGSVVPLKDLL